MVQSSHTTRAQLFNIPKLNGHKNVRSDQLKSDKLYWFSKGNESQNKKNILDELKLEFKTKITTLKDINTIIELICDVQNAMNKNPDSNEIELDLSNKSDQYCKFAKGYVEKINILCAHRRESAPFFGNISPTMTQSAQDLLSHLEASLKNHAIPQRSSKPDATKIDSHCKEENFYSDKILQNKVKKTVHEKKIQISSSQHSPALTIPTVQEFEIICKNIQDQYSRTEIISKIQEEINKISQLKQNEIEKTSIDGESLSEKQTRIARELANFLSPYHKQIQDVLKRSRSKSN